MSDRWSWSRSGDDFAGDYATREEAATIGPDEYGSPDDGPGYTGRAVAPPVDRWVRAAAEVLTDAVSDRAYVDTGEHSADWCTRIPRADLARLGDMLAPVFRRWLRQTGREPTFRAIEDVEEVRGE